MKRSFLFAGLLLCAGISCKKSNSGSSGSYHVTATVDGKAEKFNVNAIADKITVQGVTSLTLTGFVTNSPTGETITLNVSTIYGRPLPIKAGTYSDTTTLYDVDGFYQTSMSDMYEAGTSISQSAGTAIVNHFKLVITSLDSSSIKGTFSGDFIGGIGSDQPKKTITNGDFYVKLLSL